MGTQVSTYVTRAAGLALGVAADAAFGDPHRGHPVALLGRGAGALEGLLWRDSRPRGVAFTAAVVVPVTASALIAERLATRHWAAHLALTATTTWAVLGARSLYREGLTMADHLDAHDLASARARLSHLCGRSPDGLDTPELARATIESLAENTADAVVASLTWGAVAGVPGLVLHRTANTLDAMVGHRTERYAHFGTASARLDDLPDYVPARLTGLLAGLLAPVVGGRTDRTLRVVRRDHAQHPSPNGGWCESAWAGALGVTLGGRNVYASGVEDRPLLGNGPRPGPEHVRRAAHLVAAVTIAATAVATSLPLAGAAIHRVTRRPA